MLRNYFNILLFTISLLSVTFAQKTTALELKDSMYNWTEMPPLDELLILMERLESQSRDEGNKDVLAFSLFGRANTYLFMEKYNLYESSLNEYMAMAIDTAELGMQHYSNAISGLATLANLKADFKKAIELEFESIEAEKKNPETSYGLATKYTNISIYYRLLGDYNNSLATARKALIQFEKKYNDFVGNELSFVMAYINIAYSLIDLERMEEASSWINKALNLHDLSEGTRNKTYYEYSIDLYLQRAKINMQEESFEKALKDLEEVVELQKSTKYRIYFLHEFYGEYHTKKSNFIKAIENYNSALEDATLVYSDNKEFPAIPRIYKRRANNYVKLDSINLAFIDYQSGLRYFDTQLEDDWSFNPNIQISNSAPVALDLLTAKANFAKKLFEETADTTYLIIAKNTYHTAMNLIDDMRLSYINEGSKYYIVAQAQSLYREYIDLLVSAEKYFPKEEWSEEIYNTIQRNKNSVLIERIKEKVAVLSSDLPDDLKNKESKLRSDISFYTKLSSEISETDSTSLANKKSYEDELFRAKEDYAIFSNNLKLKYPEYYALSNTSKEYYKLEEVKRTLPNDEAIIEYFAMDSGYLALIISDSDVQVNVLQDENLSRLLAYYIADVSQSPVKSGKSTNDLSLQSEQLYAKLLENIRGLADIGQLYIIPDGVISKLPFSSLINPETKEYLLSEKSISYLVSVDQFMNPEKSTSDSKSILALSPNFSTTDDVIDCQCNGSDLTDLIYAMDELTYLQSIYDGSYINQADATVASFTDNVQDYSIVHLATHACLNETDPMLSQIFFSDGSLTNYDLQNLNISPELVVLAACNTAQGEIQKGEGVISLSRGFFEAGVKSLVSSLWSIDDYSSSEVVKGMYTHLKNGKTKAQAIRQSKLDYLESADKLRSHPYYWAGLVQIGDNSPIITPWDWSVILSMSLLLFVIILLFLRGKIK